MSYTIIKIENNNITPIVVINCANDEHAKKYVIQYCIDFIKENQNQNEYFADTVNSIYNLVDGFYIHNNLTDNSYDVYSKKTNYGYIYNTYDITKEFSVIYKLVEETKIMPKNNMNEMIYNELSSKLKIRRQYINHH